MSLALLNDTSQLYEDIDLRFFNFNAFTCDKENLAAESKLSNI